MTVEVVKDEILGPGFLMFFSESISAGDGVNRSIEIYARRRQETKTNKNKTSTITSNNRITKFRL
jgi:hypothetical protein